MDEGVAAARIQTKYAGFWLRFWAIVIDGILLSFPFVVIGFFLGYYDPPGIEDWLSLLQLLNFVVLWLYNAILESSTWQATIGKRLFSLRVTDMNGQQISFGRATGRYFGKIVSGLIFGLGYVIAAFTDRKQALHDMMAGCTAPGFLDTSLCYAAWRRSYSSRASSGVR